MQQRYEYRVIQSNRDYGLSEQINNFANEGWRAVNITHAMEGACTTYTVLMERVIPRKSTEMSW